LSVFVVVLLAEKKVFLHFIVFFRKQNEIICFLLSPIKTYSSVKQKNSQIIRLCVFLLIFSCHSMHCLLNYSGNSEMDSNLPKNRVKQNKFPSYSHTLFLFKSKSRIFKKKIFFRRDPDFCSNMFQWSIFRKFTWTKILSFSKGIRWRMDYIN